jgi:phasin family protein
MSAETSQVTDISGTSGAIPAAPKKAAAPKKSTAQTKSSAPSAAEAMAAWPNVDVAKFFEEGRERVREAFEQVNGRFEGARSTARESSELLLQSNSAVLSGFRDMSERVFDGIQSDLDRAHDCFKAATEAKDVSELVQIQTDFVRESLEAQLEQSRALADAATGIFKSAFEPLQSGMASVLEKAGKR